MSSANASKTSKKRKLVDSSEPLATASKRKASLSVSNDNSRNGLKPLVASTPSIALTPDTELTLYESTSSGSFNDGKKDKGKGRALASMLQGESEKLEWTSSNRMPRESLPWRTSAEETVAGHSGSNDIPEESSALYALALYDPSTSSVTVIDAPLHILSHIPKRLKNLPAISSRDAGSNNAQARTDLGLTFGTKKSQKAIKAAERNRVDAGAQDLQVLQDVMQQGLEEGLETLPASSRIAGIPTQDGQGLTDSAIVEAARIAGRPIPNLSAGKPDDVYEVFGSIVLQKEYEAINSGALLRLTADEKEKGCAMLPFKRSTWVNDRVKDVLANRGGKYKEKERVTKLKLLVWISALMNLRTARGGIDTTQPDQVDKYVGRLVGYEAGQSILERFTEGLRGTKSRQVTPGSEIRLLTHLFVACLAYESYGALDFQTISNDMSYNIKRATELVKMLGCRMIQPKGKDAERILASWRTDGRTLPDSDSGKLKVATLTIPLEFPREKTGAKAKGR